jgi:hypothetical protein
VLVATVLTLLLAGGLLSIFGPGNLAFRAQPALTDMQQRLRFATDVLSAVGRAAGAAPPGGLSGDALGLQTACVLPYRFGHRRADPPGSVETSRVTLVTGRPSASVAFLRVALLPGAAAAEIDATRCASPAPACGIAEGTNLLLLPGGGAADLFRVVGVAAASLTLARAATTVPRSYPPGTPLVPVDIDVFHLRQGTEDDGTQLMRYDGWESDLPQLDRVVRFEVALFGEAGPPRARDPAGPGDPRTTYGPAPPADGVDDPADAWGAGENCVFSRVSGAVVPRLAALAPDPVSLVRLDAAVLADGPWCPDPAAANRFDADLLRVRRIRIELGVEAPWATSRGPHAALFARPGTAGNPHAQAPDQHVTIDIVARSLGGW